MWQLIPSTEFGQRRITRWYPWFFTKFWWLKLDRRITLWYITYRDQIRLYSSHLNSLRRVFYCRNIFICKQVIIFIQFFLLFLKLMRNLLLNISELFKGVCRSQSVKISRLLLIRPLSKSITSLSFFYGVSWFSLGFAKNIVKCLILIELFTSSSIEGANKVSMRIDTFRWFDPLNSCAWFSIWSNRGSHFLITLFNRWKSRSHSTWVQIWSNFWLYAVHFARIFRFNTSFSLSE